MAEARAAARVTGGTENGSDDGDGHALATQAPWKAAAHPSDTQA